MGRAGAQARSNYILKEGYIHIQTRGPITSEAQDKVGGWELVAGLHVRVGVVTVLWRTHGIAVDVALWFIAGQSGRESAEQGSSHTSKTL